jgi:hypothetical protein
VELQEHPDPTSIPSVPLSTRLPSPSPPAPARLPSPQPSEPQEYGETAVAEYDYEAQEENELSFPEGAVITNIERVDEAWWVGEYEGHSGLFPCMSVFWGLLTVANYVKV